ncbi:MAG: hypothetical protein AAFV90_26305 [Cyanobacteria bacterium J06634_5]
MQWQSRAQVKLRQLTEEIGTKNTALLLEKEALIQTNRTLKRQMVRRTAGLLESERKLSTLMKNLPGMAFRCHNDPIWTMVFASEGCLSLTG